MFIGVLYGKGRLRWREGGKGAHYDHRQLLWIEGYRYKIELSFLKLSFEMSLLSQKLQCLEKGFLWNMFIWNFSPCFTWPLSAPA